MTQNPNLPAANPASSVTSVLVSNVAVPLLFIAVGIIVGKFVLNKKDAK